MCGGRAGKVEAGKNLRAARRMVRRPLTASDGLLLFDHTERGGGNGHVAPLLGKSFEGKRVITYSEGYLSQAMQVISSQDHSGIKVELYRLPSRFAHSPDWMNPAQ